MSNELRKQIYENMNVKETDELLDIWQTNNRVEWSDEAFEAIKDILKERGVEIPEQDNPIYEIIEEDEDMKDDGLDEWEAKLLDDENQPEYYDTLEVLELRDKINKTAKAVIVIYALTSLMSFSYFNFLIRSYFPGMEEYSLFVDLIAFIVACINAVITIAIIYFPLKALAYILRILMEMEFNSRRAKLLVE